MFASRPARGAAAVVVVVDVVATDGTLTATPTTVGTLVAIWTLGWDATSLTVAAAASAALASDDACCGKRYACTGFAAGAAPG